MKKEIAEMWVAALRSGKYNQGRSVLKNSKNAFCCLGVLCDLAVKNKIIPEATQEIPGGQYAYQTYDVAGISNPVVKEWSGLKSVLGSIVIDQIQKTLANLNDRGATFNEIADIIEQRYEEL